MHRIKGLIEEEVREKLPFHFKANSVWFFKHHSKEFKWGNLLKLPYLYCKHLNGMRGINMGD